MKRPHLKHDFYPVFWHNKTMTCFSIHKILVFGLVLTLGFSGSVAANAQSTPSSRERDKDKVRVDAPIVLELYTASDCSACIFADRMLYDAAKDKNVIALSCHIEDTNVEGKGKPDSGPIDPCVLRQWAYSSAKRDEAVDITIPTFIFNGRTKVGSGRMQDLPAEVENYHFQHVNDAVHVPIRWKDDNTISIQLPENQKRLKAKRVASVWIIRYKDMEVEKIETGTNAGKVLRFSNIVQSVEHVGKWHGSARTIDVDVTKPQGGKERGGYAVIVQEMMGTPILAAGKLADYPTPADARAVKETPTTAPPH